MSIICEQNDSSVHSQFAIVPAVKQVFSIYDLVIFVQFDLKLQRLEKELRLFKYAFDLQQRMKENNDNRKLSLREDDPLAFKNKKTFKKIVWNGETKEFLCRTWLSWVKILSFYFIFYCVLAVFVYCLWLCYNATILDTKPKYYGDEGGIMKVPGLAFRPSPPLSEDNRNFDLLKFDPKNPARVKEIKLEIDELLSPYRQDPTCGDKEGIVSGKACLGDVDKIFGPCTSDNNYGYNSTSPCIFLKLNKIYNWTPYYYNHTDKILKNIKKTENNKPIASDFKGNLIWVSCSTTDPKEAEKMGTVEYYPRSGFPSSFYPFLNQEKYLSPLVAVRFDSKLKLSGASIRIECKAWAKNIEHDSKERRGSTKFYLQVLNDKDEL